MSKPAIGKGAGFHVLVRAVFEIYVDGLEGPASGGSGTPEAGSYEGKFVVERIGEVGRSGIGGLPRSAGASRVRTSLEIGLLDPAEEKPLSLGRSDLGWELSFEEVFCFGWELSFEEVFCFGLVRSLKILISCPSNREATLLVLVFVLALTFLLADGASKTFEVGGTFELDAFCERRSFGIVVLEAAKKPLTVLLGASGKAA